jgi:arginase family enzyme
LIRGLEELDIIGCDVVELVPPYDDGTSAFAAARIIYELLGNISKKK